MKIIKYTLIIVLVVASLSGFFAGRNLGIKIGLEQGRKESEAQISKLQEKIEPTPEILKSSTTEEVFVISGMIKSIEENVIILETEPFIEKGITLTSEEAEKKLQKETRKILINESTKITKINPLSFIPKKEMSQSEAEKLLIKLSDLKSGDNISVLSEESIKTKEEFTASLIWVN